MLNEVFKCDSELFSSYLAEQLRSFVEYKVNVGGCVPESFIPVLKRFDSYCYKFPLEHLCLKSETVLKFLEQQDVKKSTAMRVTSIIRSLGKYMIIVLRLDDVYVVPRLIKHSGKTFVPYVFTYEEIASLIDASNRYTPKIFNKPTTNLLNCMRCIMAMLYCTGMRVSEVSYLKVTDVDLDHGIIHINHAKNDNHRIVTISKSLTEVCLKYLKDSGGYFSSGIYFFDSGASFNEGQVTGKCIYSYFRRFLLLAGIEHKGNGFGPRLHDLRVTFAVHSLQNLTTATTDINSYLMYLSTYMGHQSIYETQDYLWLTGELFQNTLDKMEDYTSFISEIFKDKVGEWDDE